MEADGLQQLVAEAERQLAENAEIGKCDFCGAVLPDPYHVYVVSEPLNLTTSMIGPDLSVSTIDFDYGDSFAVCDVCDVVVAGGDVDALVARVEVAAHGSDPRAREAMHQAAEEMCRAFFRRDPRREQATR